MKILNIKTKIKEFKNTSTLKNKLIYVYIVGIVIPFILISSVYCLFAVNNARERMKKELEYDVEKIASNIEECVDQGLGIINNIYYDNELMNILELNDGSIYDYFSASKKVDLIAQYTIQYEFAEKITIYSYNTNLYKSASLLPIDSLKNDNQWLTDFYNKNRDISVISYRDRETNKIRLSIIRKLNYFGGTDILKFDISPSYLEKKLEYTKFNCNLWLIDNDNNTIITNGNMNKLNTPNYRVDYIERQIFSLDNYSVFCNYNLKITSNRLLVLFLIFVFIVLMLVLLLILLLIKPIILRLGLLTKSIEEIQYDRFEKISEKNLVNDELGKIIKCYNIAIERIDYLINKEYLENIERMELENEKNKAKFALLLSQTNPHFMFNILEIMRMNMIKKHDKEAAQLIYKMSLVLRNIVSWKKDLIKLSQEMEVVTAYLDLSNFGFENNIDIIIDVSDEALECVIPKMSVQIFAENAICHGLEDILYKGKIEIIAYVDDDILKISISDNGIGMSPEAIDAINNQKIEEKSDYFGIGISNVIERLRIYYGDKASLKAESVPNTNTSFVLEIPLDTNKEN